MSVESKPGAEFELSKFGLWVLDPDTLAVRDKRAVPAEIFAMALDPDGERFAYGMANGGLVISDARTLDPLLEVRAHEGAIETMTISPDGRRLATGGEDEEVCIWDVETGERLLRFETPGAQDLLSLAFTPDGRRILTGSRLTSIGIWDAETGQELLRLHGHDDYVHDLDFSPDGRILASASGDGNARLWDARPLAERFETKQRLLSAEAGVREKVEGWLTELGSLEAVLAAIAADPDLDELERYAATNVAESSRDD
jgi:WD40 repeat protein